MQIVLVLDHGALQALQKGGSLLAAGVIQVSGQFSKGDCVKLISEQGDDLGRGLCNYSAQEAGQILGQHSSQFPDILGYCGISEMIHRNDLALFDQSKE